MKLNVLMSSYTTFLKETNENVAKFKFLQYFCYVFQEGLKKDSGANIASQIYLQGKVRK